MPFPVDVRNVHSAEQRLGVRFPLSFVSRMLPSNGGTVNDGTATWFLFPFFDDSDRRRLARTCNDIVRETIAARDRPGFPAGGVAIGHDGGGGVLLLLPDDEDPSRLGDSVYAWYGALEDHVASIADDFLDLPKAP